MLTLWERVVGVEGDPTDPTEAKLKLHQFGTALFEACNDVGETGPPGQPAYDKTWTGKTVTRASIVSTFNLSDEQNNSSTGNIDLQFLLDVYESTSDMSTARNFIEDVFGSAETGFFGYDSELIARARLDLIATN